MKVSQMTRWARMALNDKGSVESPGAAPLCRLHEWSSPMHRDPSLY